MIFVTICLITQTLIIYLYINNILVFKYRGGGIKWHLQAINYLLAENIKNLYT